MTLLEINWIATLVGAVAAYALGALWFSPKVFGRAWMAAQPHRKPEDYNNNGLSLAVEAAATLLLAILTSWLLLAGGPAAVLLLAATLTISHLGGALFLGQPVALWSLPASYKLVSIAIIVVANFLF